MSRKRKALAIVIFLFLLIAFSIVYIFSELYNEDEIDNPFRTDAIKFKEEYEGLNKKTLNDKEFREVSISQNNPIIYISAEDLAKKIDNKESFVVYFGFDSCPWCRSIIEPLMESATKNKVKILYYVDVKDIRDKYELNDKNKAVRTVEGSEGYYSLLKKLDPVLNVYSPLVYTYKKKMITVKINEKRIYAPNVIVVKNGEALKLESGIPKDLTDPYMKFSSEMKKESIDKFNCLFDTLNEKNTCSCDEAC